MTEEEEDLIRQLCCDLNSAHNELMQAFGSKDGEETQHDWPEWSSQANTIRWAEKLLGRKLAKTDAWTLFPEKKFYLSPGTRVRDRHGHEGVIARLYDDFSAVAASCLTMTGDEWFAQQDPPLPESVKAEPWANVHVEPAGAVWCPLSTLTEL